MGTCFTFGELNQCDKRGRGKGQGARGKVQILFSPVSRPAVGLHTVSYTKGVGASLHVSKAVGA
jgi:hypothetical protein